MVSGAPAFNHGLNWVAQGPSGSAHGPKCSVRLRFQRQSAPEPVSVRLGAVVYLLRLGWVTFGQFCLCQPLPACGSSSWPQLRASAKVGTWSGRAPTRASPTRGGGIMSGLAPVGAPAFHLLPTDFPSNFPALHLSQGPDTLCGRDTGYVLLSRLLVISGLSAFAGQPSALVVQGYRRLLRCGRGLLTGAVGHN